MYELLATLLFQIAVLALVLPVLLVSTVYLFYPDPFRVTKDCLKQCPYFYFEHEQQINSQGEFKSVLETATDEKPVYVLLGSKTCTALGGAYAIFHKFFKKYNVFVVYTETADLDEDYKKLHNATLPILIKFGDDGNILETTKGLWSNEKMRVMLNFVEENIKIFG